MSALSVIVTRAEPGATITASHLDALGYHAVISPALTLQADPHAVLPPPDTVSGLIFTSANGVIFYTEREADRSLPAWCVGPATAQAAREAGFPDVHESSGNAVDLAATIASTIAPPDLPLLHIANSAAKGDLKRELKMRRYRMKFAPIYHADTAPYLDAQADTILDQRLPAIILIHSAKGAAAFRSLLRGRDTSSLSVAAISTPAARPLAGLALQSVCIARAPNERALMDAVKAAAAALST